jgi:hypothetical protein
MTNYISRLERLKKFRELTDSAISLRSARNHVLDEITMSRGINDGDVEFGSLKLPKSNVDRDTTLTFGF